MQLKHLTAELVKKILGFTLIAGVFFTSAPQAAYAQWATTNPDVLANDLAGTIQAETKDQVKGALLGALAGVGINLLDYVMTLTAQSTAVWIANGGAGKNPLFNSQTIEEVGQSVAGTIVSDVLDQIVPGAGSLAAIGINPNNPEITGVLRKMLGAPYQQVQLTADGRLDGGSIGRNFSSYIASTAAIAGAGTKAGASATTKIIADTMNAASTNEFYGLLRTYGQTQARAANLASVKQYQNIINSGFEDLKSPISNKIKWPAASVKQKLDDAIRNKQQNDADIGKNLIQAAGEDAVIQVGINFLTTFAGTLFGELTQKLFDGLLDGIGPVTVNPFDPTQVGPGRSGEELFRSLGAFRPLKATGYSLTAQLASCPATLLRSSRGVYTCAMDTSFVTVVTRGNSNNPSTVAEAIQSGEINGSWPLIGPEAALNKDPNCYQRAFCHSNLLKLRKARIVPIGWEMAAEISGDGKFTLQQVMDGFYDCNEEGARDANHPFCKLIDPNWVLRAPEAVCRTLAYGQQLATSAGPNRTEECVDIQTCLEEGPNGECLGGFGYCVREANVWRFRGDACTADAASCQVLADRDNQSVSYLLNTVDYAECGPDKVGCHWYETEKTIDDEGNFDWPTVNNVEEDAAEDFGNASRIYANAAVETCADGGCRELIARSSDLVYNMVQNGSFEEDDNSDRFPDAWLKGAATAETVSGRGIANGKALRLTSAGTPEVNYLGLLLEGGREYALTVNARVPEGATANATVSATLDFAIDNPSDGAVNFDFTGYRLEGLEPGVSCRQIAGTNSVRVERVLNSGEDYVKLGCIFALPNLPDTIRNVAGTLTLRTSSGEALFDDVQMEQRAQASNYAFGYSRAGAKVYAKLPPAYLGCTGGAGDAAECAQYAKVCSPLDEGCKLYTPINGDPSVSAIVGAGNSCPAVCSGYDTYKQEPTYYEPEGVFPQYFIASTAKTCNATAAGCDTFTNLTTEQTEYYSYVRACLNTTRATDRGGVFYTWEGSDTTGYQIKTWNLLMTNMAVGADDPLDASAPCTTWSASVDGITCTDDVNVDGVPDSRRTSCDDHADIFTNPDCRQFYDSEGRIHYREWSKTVSINDACTSYRKGDIAGADTAAKEANCESSGGYFDADNGSCIYYGFKDESTSCSEAENGCRLYTGGRGNNSRIVLQEFFENGVINTGEDTIPGWDASAQGAVGLSTESLANEGTSIRSVGTRFWTYYAKLANNATCGTQGGCVDSPVRSSRFGEQCKIAQGESICGALNGKLYTGKTYSLYFWAKGTGTVHVGFASEAPSDESTVQITNGLESRVFELSSEWKEYRLGPIDVSEEAFPNFGPNSVLVFDPSSDATVYVDNIVLREGEENIALIRDSWSTPAVCDTDAGGNYVPQYNLGCREYTSSSGERVYLKSFSRLCGEDKVGCSAFYDTQASDSPYGAVYNAYCTRVLPGTGSVECRLEQDPTSADGYAASSPRLCTIQPGQSSCRFNLSYYLPEVTTRDTGLRMTHIAYESDTETVAPDMPVYAVVTSGSQCNAADAGCTEVGVPVLSPDQSRVSSWEDTNLLLDPDQFTTALCHEEDLFCEEYTDGKQNKYYFKDPQAKVCEFKEKVTIDGKEYSGWFVTGTTNFCYGVGTCQASPATACVTDSDCPIIGTGTCSVFGTSCTQDSDCRLNESCLGATADVCRKDQPVLGGRCSNNLATSCDENADCNAPGETVNTCITPYIKSGTESGLWRSGDDAYDGWVGVCDPSNSGCREFLDPLDGLESDTPYGQTDIKSYYYIENGNLTDATLAAGQKCNGQASTEEGCVLFQDTSLPRLTYSTSATAIASEHADTLFGKSKYDLVTPVNCDEGAARSSIQMPNGSVVDLCAQRCVYDQFKVNDINASYTDIASFLEAQPDALTPNELEQAYIFGGSCMIDNDCDPVRSDSGDLVEGSCRGVVFNTLDAVDGNTTAVPRLENDTNRVLKVSRNRTCAEWIAPDDCRKIWDPELNQFRESCSRLVLCEEYDESGAFACKKPKALDAAVPIDMDFYSSRDASWYGNDYSGYAIGGQFLLNHLSQEQINDKQVCVVDAADGSGDSEVYRNGQGKLVPCTQNGQCSSFGATCKQNPDPEYALAYNAGACLAEDQGGVCAVGYCANSGAACADGGQCPGSTCVVGRCIALMTQDGEARRCQQDADCGNPNAVCNAGVCEEDLGVGCNIEDGPNVGGDIQFGCGTTTGRADALCNISTSYKTGTCLNQKCLLTPTGEEYPVEGGNGVETYSKVCRANPEIDSPFSTSIVEKWNEYAHQGGGDWAVQDSTESAKQAYPYDVRSGFESANICAPGEVCSCSYKKLTASGKTGYVEVEADTDRIATLVADSFREKGVSISTAATLGICSGGPADGAFCVIDNGDEYGCKTQPNAVPGQESFASGSFGTCNPINREDQLVGLKGYCLERDSGINIDGDPNLGACLTYFPIDELRGETDLYGKYKEAGYFEDAFYCTDVATYANFGALLGCSAKRGEDGLGGDNCAGGVSCSLAPDVCKKTVTCPAGYWAIVGQATEGVNHNTYSQSCEENGILSAPLREGGLLPDTFEYDLWDREHHGCPFVCVPYNSVQQDDGTACGVPSNPTSVITSVSGTRAYYYEDYQQAADKIAEYLACSSYGIDLEDDDLAQGVYDFLDRTEDDYPMFDVDNPKGSLPTLLKIQLNPGATAPNFHDVVLENPLHAAEYYPACRVTSQLSSSNGADGAAPYTDRLLNPLRRYALSAFAGASYLAQTEQGPFGATLDPRTRETNYYGHSEAAPFAIPSCVMKRWRDNHDPVVDDETGDAFMDYSREQIAIGAYRPYWTRPFYMIPYGLDVITNTNLLKGVSDCLYNWDDQDANGDPELDAIAPNYGNDPEGSTEAMPFITYGPNDRPNQDENHLFINVVELKDRKIQAFGGEDHGTVGERLGRMFARSLEHIPDATYVWNSIAGGAFGLGGSSRGAYENGDSPVSWDVRDTGDEDYDPTPPVIYSVDFNNCKGRNCREGQVNAFSLNGETNQDFVVNDEGFFRASVEFFAAAAKEQLPLRRIIVDWGTGEDELTGSSTADNFYKNHRGLDPEANDAAYCSLGTEWGLTEDSCEPTWLRYTKTYVCGDDAAERFGTCNQDGETDVNCFDATTGYCIFQPRVHVRDNWGWCTGTCRDNGALDGNNPACLDITGDISGYSSESECNYIDYPKSDAVNNPWVEYSGTIRIRQQ